MKKRILIIDDQEDLIGMDAPKSWCEDCEAFVILVEAEVPKYREV